jgi:hypothetical protein
MCVSLLASYVSLVIGAAELLTRSVPNEDVGNEKKTAQPFACKGNDSLAVCFRSAHSDVSSIGMGFYYSASSI